MASCLILGVDSYLKVSPSLPLNECQLVAISTTEYNDMVTTPINQLTIDPEIYTLVSGYMLLSFLSGHVLGRILKGLGKG
ncbi:conserved protein of unknown function [Vibrio tapetis subsp. tapetis]|uniref:Uncharacterized protein n=1 Tax=Vibrio tapetis subsp. tapetis TaxID=1671868 RepID=A0A2N8Z9Q1_9VIBR|nr:conserved protein of unknown function [Vibrio tapetis subsp. tapetis]